MAKTYDYVLDVWLRLQSKAPVEDLENELREHLETSYILHKVRAIEKSDENTGQDEFSIQVQTSFQEPQMSFDEPTDQAVEELSQELRAYLEQKYEVTYLEVLDDSLYSFLLNISEE